VGGFGLVVDLGILTLMLYLIGTEKTDFMISQSISFMGAATWNFVFNRLWTFDSRTQSMGRQYVKFMIIAVSAFIIRSGISYIGVDMLGISKPPYYQILTFGVILIVTIFNYIGSKFWAFRK
jgi:putative flippase GtrA